MPAKKVTRTRTPSVIPREPLAKEIARIIDERGLTQTEAGYVIRDSPSQISLIVNGKLKGFSPERLIRTLARLGQDVEIHIAKAKGKTGAVRVSVKR